MSMASSLATALILGDADRSLPKAPKAARESPRTRSRVLLPCQRGDQVRRATSSASASHSACPRQSPRFRMNLTSSSSEIGSERTAQSTPRTSSVAPKPHGEASVVIVISGSASHCWRSQTLWRPPRCFAKKALSQVTEWMILLIGMRSSSSCTSSITADSFRSTPTVMSSCRKSSSLRLFLRAVSLVTN